MMISIITLLFFIIFNISLINKIDKLSKGYFIGISNIQ